jgi:formamidase
VARPFTEAEKAKGQRLAARWSVSNTEPLAPISVNGTAANLNDAIKNGLARAANLLGVIIAEIRNRATVAGAIQAGGRRFADHSPVLTPSHHPKFRPR